MALPEAHWLLFWAMLVGVACLVVLAVSGLFDNETTCEMGRAAHVLASFLFTSVVPGILQA